MKIIMRRDCVIFHLKNNTIDNAVRRCLSNTEYHIKMGEASIFLRMESLSDTDRKNIQKAIGRIGEKAELSETLQISVEFWDELIYIGRAGK